MGEETVFNPKCGSAVSRVDFHFHFVEVTQNMIQKLVALDLGEHHGGKFLFVCFGFLVKAWAGSLQGQCETGPEPGFLPRLYS